ncbi:MAG: hypothetical protein IT193_06895 [Propionibacteriaceae bacterium]|nr:hypothetical protein [Propionibacteriaceae bacterium]
MRDPKNLPWVYIATGVVAVVAAIFFMSVASESSLFDWVILAMGIVAIVRGVQEYLKLRRPPQPPAKS